MEKRFNGSLAILVILVFLFFPAAIIYYFMRREEVHRCRRCNAELPSQASFCPMCATPTYQSTSSQPTVDFPKPQAVELSAVPMSSYDAGIVIEKKTEMSQPPQKYPQYLQESKATASPQVSHQEPAPSKYCKYCGQRIDADSVFCDTCGKRI